MNNKTVLITDDDKLTREGLATMLRSRGHNVIEAEDGQQAFELLSTETKPDLVISDVRMPNMDGIELVAKIRHSDDLHQLPVIILTNDDSAVTLNRALAAGVTVYLSKTNLGPEELSAQILIALGS